MVFTYLLKSLKDGSFYTGISSNPEARLQKHNAGLSPYSKLKSPWVLVYKKAHDSYKEARKHEMWLKKKNRVYKQSLTSLRKNWRGEERKTKSCCPQIRFRCFC